MPLEITVSNEPDDKSRLRLNGSLDSETAPQLEAAFGELTSRTLILDMAELSFISSAGLRVIFAKLKQQKTIGGRIVICNMSPGVKKVFEIVKALPDLNIFSSTEEMDAYLASFQ